MLLSQRQSSVSHQNHRRHIQIVFPLPNLSDFVRQVFILCFYLNGRAAFPTKTTGGTFKSHSPCQTCLTLLGRFLFYDPISTAVYYSFHPYSIKGIPFKKAS